ncbi:Nsp1-like C-terminal region-domain-containing protein [Sparassis latifolia]
MPTAVGSGLGAGTSTPGVSGGTGGAGTSTPSLLSRLGEANTSTPSGTGGANTSTPSPFGGLGVTNTTTPSPFAGLGGGSTSTPSAFGGGASKPNLFGNIGASTSTPTTNTTSTAIPNFFAKPPENKDTPASTLSGFGILGQGQKNAGTAAGEKKDTAPPTGIPNFFGNKATSSTATEKKDSAAPPMLGLFGSKDTGAATAEKKDGAPASLPTFNLFPPKDAASKNTQPISSFALGSTTANKDGDKSKAPSTTPGATAGAAAQALGATTTAAGLIAFPPPSVLRGKTIEEIVNRWTNEIDLHVHEFNKFAGEVAVWDRALIDNGNNLAALYALVLAAEREQNDIDQSLDHIEQQQRDLGGALEAYERSTDEVLGGRGSNLRALDTGPADTERDKNYMLATELHGHLDDLSGSLTQMIDAVNALALPSGSTAGAPKDGGEDPVGQIAQILNSHLESLLWIDGAAREVETTINDVEKRVRAAGDGSLGSTFNKSRGAVDVGR